MFNLKDILKVAIKSISNALNMFTPDQIPDETKATIQKIVGPSYALLKNIGPGLVAGTETDLDDVVLQEFIEVCELAETKYGIILNPKDL